MLIHEQSRPGRRATAQAPLTTADSSDLPAAFRRKQRAALPEVSELQAVRHYTRLSQQNFSIDTHFYPLGSCTMKYNPRACNSLASLPGFLARHPAAPETHSQGIMACLHELQDMLKVVTGMHAVSLAPAAGAQGEFAGVEHDPRLPRRPRRHRAARDPGTGCCPRHQPGLGDHGRLRGPRDPDRRQWRRRPRRAARRRRTKDRRHHADQPQHRRRVRPQHPGHRQDRA